MPGTLKKTALFLIVASIFVLPALADRTNVRPAWNMFSPQQDIEMGRVLADDAERTFRLIEWPDANAYIDALGKQLAVHAPRTRYPYQFKIVDSDDVNAWALPGGYVYVTSGLIESAENEPQLAGAVAHEIAHVVLRHGTAEVSQAYTNRVSRTTRGVSVDDAMASLNIRFEPNSIPLRYSRAQEREAHILATQIMYDARFDPAPMNQVFQKIASDRSSRTSDFFNAHPYRSNYAAVVRTELRNLGALPPNVRGDSPDFHTIKDRLLAADTTGWPSISDNNGADGPDVPSNRMVLYRGRDIEFRHPDNWRVSETGRTISIAPDGGFVSGSLAYGMSIATFDPQGSTYFDRNSFSTQGTRANTTLANATDQLIDQLRQSNPNMRVTRNTERRYVDGEQAMVVQLTNDSPLGGAEMDWLVTVLRPDGLLRYFVGVAPQRDFSRYQPVFDDILDSVRFLN